MVYHKFKGCKCLKQLLIGEDKTEGELWPPVVGACCLHITIVGERWVMFEGVNSKG